MTCSNCTDHRVYIAEDVDNAIKLHCAKWRKKILLVTLCYCHKPPPKASAGPVWSWAGFAADMYLTKALEMVLQPLWVSEMFLVYTWKALSKGKNLLNLSINALKYRNLCWTKPSREYVLQCFSFLSISWRFSKRFYSLSVVTSTILYFYDLSLWLDVCRFG